MNNSSEFVMVMALKFIGRTDSNDFSAWKSGMSLLAKTLVTVVPFDRVCRLLLIGKEGYHLFVSPDAHDRNFSNDGMFQDFQMAVWEVDAAVQRGAGLIFFDERLLMEGRHHSVLLPWYVIFPPQKKSAVEFSHPQYNGEGITLLAWDNINLEVEDLVSRQIGDLMRKISHVNS